MKAIVILFLLGVGLNPATGQSSILTVDPENPVVGDTVTITMTGWWMDSCWSLVDQACSMLRNGVIVIEAFGYDAMGRESDVCLQMVVGYEVVCTYKDLAAGEYRVHAVEHADSLRYPGEREWSLTFFVSPLVSSDGLTWTTLKRMYR